MSATTAKAEFATALAVARTLVGFGVPVFVARPALRRDGTWDPVSGHNGCGYWLPTNWQQTVPSLDAVDAWRPGMALCALMGHGVDLLDVDDRNGGRETRTGLLSAGMWPRAYGVADTPSGGTHEFVADLGVRSRDAVQPGLDVKAGDTAGAGRGFAFIAPTVKLSKTTGEIAAYRWTSVPDPDVLADAHGDDSGGEIAELARRARGSSNGSQSPQDGATDPDGAREWLVAEPIPVGSRYPWLRSYAGWLRHNDTRLPEALVLMRSRWQACEQPASYPMPWADAEALLRDLYARYAPRAADLLAVQVTDADPDDPDAALEAQLEQAATFARAVEVKAHELRVRDAATRKVATERTGAVARPTPIGLGAFLAVPDEATTHRVAGLWPNGGRVVLAAQFKAGKSTLLANVLRCLVDGTPFLGAHVTHPVRRVVLIDDELDERTLRRWLRDQGVVNVDAVRLLSLRGAVGAFDLLDPVTRAEWAADLAGDGVVLLDCLRPVLDALGLDESREAGRFLVAFDALLKQAGVAEALVVHHMGHHGERSRGDSRILDWPDATWKLVREDPEDPSSARYFSAFGRDVEVGESRLEYDPTTRRLRVAGGSRKDTAAEALLPELEALLDGNPEGLSGRQIEKVMVNAGHGRNEIRQAVARAVKTGMVRTHRGDEE